MKNLNDYITNEKKKTSGRVTRGSISVRVIPSMNNNNEKEKKSSLRVEQMLCYSSKWLGL